MKSYLLGIILSWACAIHCMAMPLLVSVSPALGGSFAISESTEHLILLAAAAISVYLLAKDIKHHHSYKFLAMWAFGFAIILGGHWVSEYETIAAFIGSAVTALALYRNNKQTISCHC